MQKLEEDIEQEQTGAFLDTNKSEDTIPLEV
jgi:hypothetical protein